MPGVKCPEHGVKQVKVPWAREGSAFTLLFEQASRIIGIGDKRLWRIVQIFTLALLLDRGLDTATAWRAKEQLRWVRQASTGATGIDAESGQVADHAAHQPLPGTHGRRALAGACPQGVVGATQPCPAGNPALDIHI